MDFKKEGPSYKNFFNKIFLSFFHHSNNYCTAVWSVNYGLSGKPPGNPWKTENKKFGKK